MKIYPFEKIGLLRLVRSLALLALVLGGESTHTAEVLAGEPLSVVDPQLWEELGRRSSVPVMVRLRDDAGLPVRRLLRVGSLRSGAVGAYRSRIRRLQEDLESAIEPYRARGYRRHELQPVVRLDADAEMVARLAQLPMVERVREERVFRPSLSVSLPQIGADAAWDLGHAGAGQVVVVIDTGVRTDHEFLAGKVPQLDPGDPLSFAEACFSVARDPRFDGNPNNDDLAILKSYCPQELPPCLGLDGGAVPHSACGTGAGAPCTGHSSCYHGTHVSGIAVGKGGPGTAVGYSGVAKDARLVPIQSFAGVDADHDGITESLGAFESDLIAALEHVLILSESLNIASVNMSLGGDVFSSTLACDEDGRELKDAIDALRAVGIATVIASGNDGHADGIATPGCVSSAVSVGSVTRDDAVSSFSNRASMLALYAPGHGIYSSILGGGYAKKMGTSMAAPHVAGAIAVLRAQALDLGNGFAVSGVGLPCQEGEVCVDDLVTILVSSLRSTGLPIYDVATGFEVPRIQVDDALDLLAGPPEFELILDAEVAISEAVRDPQGRPVAPCESSELDVCIATGSFEFLSDSTCSSVLGCSALTSSFGGDALTEIGTGPHVIAYRPDLYPGYYDIYAWWQAFTDSAAAAEVTIYHDRSAEGHTQQIDQRSGGGAWRFLGTYALGGASPPLLELSGNGSGLLIADAVRWQKVFTIAPIVLETSSLPDAVLGQTYEAMLVASGGLYPYTWSDPDGSLAALGLFIDPETGLVYGQPTRGGKVDVSLRVTDGDGLDDEQIFTLDVSAFAGGDFGHPYVQNPQPDGVTLIWWTSHGDASGGTIGYGLSTGGAPVYTQTNNSDAPEPVTFKLADGDVLRYKHEVTLTGLDADATYDYRITQNGSLFDSHFSTAPEDLLTPIRVLVWADPEAQPGQDNAGNGAPVGAMSQAAALRASVLASSNLEPDLILAAGDLVELGRELDHWDEFFRAVNALDLDPSRPGDEIPLASRIPIQAVLGNHDYYNGALEGAEKFLHHMANPGNMDATAYTDPSWPSELDPAIRSAQNERYFALKYGPATFIGLDINNQSPNGSDLDTNFSLLGENEAGEPAPDWMPGSRQYQWLEEELQKAEREGLFTFVFFHHAPYSSGPHALPPGIDGRSGLPTRRLLDLLHRHRVDATFHGHEEAFELSRTRGDADRGGDPNHVMPHYVLPTAGDGVREKLSSLLNPFGVFHYGDNLDPGRHYGMLQLDIDADPADAQQWTARTRVLWLDDAWATGQGSDPIGGYYDDANPETASTAVSVVHLPIVLDSTEHGITVAGGFAPAPATPDAYGATALEAVSVGTNSFRFEPDLPEGTALYRLDAYWPASPAYSADISISVRQDCSLPAAIVRQIDQRTGGDQWHEIGVFELGAGACVEFSHAGPGMVVDAIRLERVRSDQPHVAAMALPPGAVDSPYSAALEVTGGAAPYRWTLFEGELPPGLLLNEVTGEIDGTPQGPDVARFTLAVADADGDTSLRQLRIAVVGDTALLIDQFDVGLLDGWSIVDEGTEDTPSDWSAEDGFLVQSSNIRDGGNGEERPGTHLVYDAGIDWTNYRAAFSVRAVDDDRFGLLFRYQDADNYYRVSWKREPENAQNCWPHIVSCVNEPFMQIIKRVGGVSTVLAELPLAFYQQELTYRMEVIALGPHLTVKRDGATVLQAVDFDLTHGTIAFGSWSQSGVHFDDLVVEELIGSTVPPVIDSVSATPTTILDTASSQLAVTAIDPDGGPQALSYQWTIPEGAGSLDDPSIAMPTYTPPDVAATASYSLTVEVSDGEAVASDSITVTVQDADAPPPALVEDFDDGDYIGWTVVDDGWVTGPSAWSAASGSLVQSSNIQDGTATTPGHLPKLGTYAVYDGGYGWTDYRATLTLRSDDDDAVGFMFRVQDGDDSYRFSWDSQRGYRRLIKNVGGEFTQLAADAVPYVQGRSYQVDILVQGALIQVSVDGVPVFSVNDAALGQGSVAAYSWGNAGVAFDDIAVSGAASGNLRPEIAAVTAEPATLLDTETSQLRATAIDPDGGPQALSYQWTIPEGAGSLDDPSIATPTYTPPDVAATASYSLTVEVSDGEAVASDSITVTVQDADAPPPALVEDFDDGDYIGWTVVDDGWVTGPSAWSAASGSLVQSSNIQDGTATTPGHLPKLGTYAVYDGGYGWTDYRATLTLRSDDDDAVGFMFRVQDGDNYYRFSWDSQRGYRRLIKNVGGEFTQLAADAVPYVQGRSYQVDILVQGALIQVSVDGVPVFSVNDAALGQGSVAAYSWGNAGVAFDDIAVSGAASGNLRPEIAAVTAEPATLLDTETSQLRATAIDPDGGPQALSYQWTIPEGAGSLDDPSIATPTYTPPDVAATASYSLTVEVSDGEAVASDSITVTVQDADAPPPALVEDFDDGDYIGWTVVDDGWVTGPSAWSAASGSLVQSSNIQDGTATTPGHLPKLGTYAVYDGGYGWTDYRATLTLRSDDDDAVGFMFRVQDGDNYYRFSWDSQRGYRRLIKNVGGEFTQLAADAVPYVQGRSYQVDILVQGALIQVSVDGVPVFSVNDAALGQGSVAAYSWGNAGVAFDDIVVSGAAGGNIP